MKHQRMIKKTAEVLAFMMLVSSFVPILAFAAGVIGFKNVEYKNGTVTGTVYMNDDIKATVTDGVYIDIYDPSLNKLTTTGATYDSITTDVYGDNWTNYNFSTAISTYGTFDSLKLWERVTDAVYHDVANTTPSTPPGDGGGGSGGGGGGGGSGGGGSGDNNPPPNPNPAPGAGKTIEITAGNEVAADVLKEALDEFLNVTIKVKGDFILLPAAALMGARNGAMIIVVNDNGSYELPLSVLKLDELAAALGVEVKDMMIKVIIQQVTGEAKAAVENEAGSLGGKLLSNIVEFKVVAQTSEGKTQEITSFGNTYVTRTLPVESTVDPKLTTGVIYDAEAHELGFVPSTFAEVNGKTTASLKRNTNSIYAVIEVKKSFNDITDHWAEADIELLANKLIVYGDSPVQFAPNRTITRAEFAALVVRSLGLSSSHSASGFSDVKAGAWYEDEVATAANAGIVFGYKEDGTFRPNELVSREQLAAMVVRASHYAGSVVNVSQQDQEQLFSPYTDADKVSTWARQELAAAVKAEIVYGMSTTTIAPQWNATRAQATAMLKRFLGNVHFINE